MKKKNVFLVILATSLSLAACSVVNSDSSTSIKDSSTISHSFSYDNSNYSPSFKRFDEIAYYSYTKPKNKNNSIKPKKKIADKTNEERQDYVDEEGRTHYPIPYSDTYFFSDFLFFEFDSDNSEFLESRIGNGHIFGLVVKTNIFNEEMLILKNEANYFSCFINGSGAFYNGNRPYKDFSSHKYIEEFDVVKDIQDKKHIVLTFGDREYNPLDLSMIEVDGNNYSINPSLVFYDDVSVHCSVNDLRAYFDLPYDIRFEKEKAREDVVAYEMSPEGSNEFVLEEYSESFRIVDNYYIYLGNEQITTLNSSTKRIFASDLNNDSYRELIFEDLRGSDSYNHAIVIYDVHNKTELFRKTEKQFGSRYFHYLDMKDERLIVKLNEPASSGDEYMLDYGYILCSQDNEISFAWQNMYELSAFKLNNIFESDGVTVINSIKEGSKDYYELKIKTTYIIEMKMEKRADATNTSFPELDYAISYDWLDNEELKGNLYDWRIVSRGNGLYRYQFNFYKGFTAPYRFLFNNFSFDINIKANEE